MNERVVLSYPHGGRRFNYRVAAIVLVDGHVLVDRQDDDDYVMLPGGRVELGEPSVLSLEREIAEELAMNARIGPLLATSESFYRRVDEDFHEIGLFYRAALADARPNGKSPWLVRQDEGHELKFYWVPLNGNALEYMNLLPRWLPSFLRNLPGTATDIVHDERMVASQ
ncbi:NUDIX hydrolase [Devosia nitrariae]|uniref:DNA mismatch repair protein MutT n=1 Tax=Devosia nitrariae TaxID=2071872 RepID=A0ABQ5WAI0_9HYPH|nr:NUDIX domain-containing protein [Devosia nitrariae]GLQ56801.1 DNA mismatch repair protein MutT [Devosia nitrariae]